MAAAGVVAAYELPAEMKLEPALQTKIEEASVSKAADSSPSHHDEFFSYVGARRKAVSPSPLADSKTYTLLLMLAVGKNDPDMLPKHVTEKWSHELGRQLPYSTVNIELASPQKAVMTVTGSPALKVAVEWLTQQPLLHWYGGDFFVQDPSVNLSLRCSSMLIYGCATFSQD